MKMLLMVLAKVWIAVLVWPVLSCVGFCLPMIALALFNVVADRYKACFGEDLGFYL